MPVALPAGSTRTQGGGHRRKRTGRPDPGRIAALDGLRGIAALVVFAHHVLVTQPQLAEAYRAPVPGRVDGVNWLLTYTPLHLLWAGAEAVLVFFVLSGLVLALPVLERRVDLVAYYPRRMLRLYLPVWAAVGVAVLSAALFPRVWHTGDSWWLRANADSPTSSGIFADLLLRHTPGTANHVLWSLHWEVLYCLALPLVLALTRRLRRFGPLAAVGVLGVLVLGAARDNAALWYLAVFALGTVMAVEAARLARAAAWLQRRTEPRSWWTAMLAASGMLLLTPWYLPAEALSGTGLGLARAGQALGACGIVFVAWYWPAAQRLLTDEIAQWLGARSFSLYLVHLPVVVAATAYLGGQPHIVGVGIYSVLITFPLTALFYRFVEQPAHRLARRVGRAITASRGSQPRPRPIMAEAARTERILVPRG